MDYREDLKINHRTRVEAFASMNENVLQLLIREALRRFGPLPLSERKIVSIAGSGCVGKSTLAEAFAKMLRSQVGYDCDWLDLDGYLLDKSQRESSFPIVSGYNPKGYELGEARNQIHFWLNTGEALEVRVYDKLTSKRTAHRRVQTRDLLIVEGVCAFCEGLEYLSSFKIFLNATKEIQYTNRWQRERNDLGRSESQIEHKFQILYPDYEKYIAPTMAMADVILKVEWEYNLSVDRIEPAISTKTSCQARQGVSNNALLVKSNHTALIGEVGL